MPTPTYTPLANLTLSSTATTVTFSSLTSYRDYRIVVQTQSGSGDSSEIGYRFNSDTGSNYNRVFMLGDGSSAASYTGTNQTSLQVGYLNPGGLTNNIVDILDANTTDKHKSVLSRNNMAHAYTFAFAGRWASTSAITSITLSPLFGNFASGSTFALYGVAA